MEPNEIPAAAVAPGLRARKQASTRARIEHAAVELFAAHGFDAVTVDDIAAAADVSRVTVFRHFRGGKEEIVFAGDQLLLDRLSAKLRAERSVPLRDLLVSYAADLDAASGDLAVPAAVIAGEPRLRDRFSVQRIRWESAVARDLLWRRTGVQDRAPSLRDRMTAAVAMSVIFVSFLGWATRRDHTFSQLVAQGIDAVGAALDDPVVDRVS